MFLDVKVYKNKSVIAGFCVCFTVLFCVFLRFIFKKDKVKTSNYFKFKSEGRKYFDSGQLYKSIDYGLKAIEENPNNPNGYFLIIKSYISVADFENANKYLDIVKDKCVSNRDKDIYNDLLNDLKNGKYEEDKYPDLKVRKNFLEWLYKNGAKIKKTVITHNENGVRGVYSTDDINKNEIIVEIPFELLIDDKSAGEFIAEKYSIENKMSKDDIMDIFNKCYAVAKFKLILYILENLNNPKFSEYFKIFESVDLSSFPNYLDEKYLSLLENTEMVEEIAFKKDVLKHDLGLLYQIGSVKKFDFETLRRYYFIVSSRIFTVVKNGEELSVLSPYIDMFNHSSTSNNYVKWFYNDSTNCFTLKSKGYIDEGVELFDSYGTKPNNELFILYGFTEVNNARKYVKLNYNGNDYKCIEMYIHKKSELKNLLSDIEKNIVANTRKRLNRKDIEILKFNEFIKICQTRLRKYKTTIEEDLKTRNSVELDFNKLNCLNVLIDEKNLLNSYIKFSNNCIKFFKRYGVKDVKKNVLKVADLDDLSRVYLNNFSE